MNTLFLLEIVIAAISLLMVVLFVLWLQRINQKNQRLQKKVAQTDRLLGQIREQEDMFQRYRHDLRKHIRLVDDLLKKSSRYASYEEYQTLAGYIREMEDDAAEQQKNQFCDHTILNAICQKTSNTCQAKGISFTADISCSDLSWVRTLDLASIFLNLLENAIEAQNRLSPNQDKSVSLSLEETNAGLRATVGNTVNHQDELFFQSNKVDSSRGVGLKIVKDTLSSYKGTIDYETNKQGHYLLVHITLSNKE